MTRASSSALCDASAPRRRARRILLLVGLICPLAIGMAPAAAATTNATVTLLRVARAPTLEDFLGGAPPPELAASMVHVDGGFVQRLPIDGEPASQHTDVWLGYDDDHLYAVFVASDSQPERIRANLTRRENFFGDDLVHLQLDTFNDQRRAYSFICNPLGVQFDAIWTEGGEFDDAFDTVWSSAGRLTAKGYVVWMAVPFKSLRFPDRQEQTWGMILNRDIPRSNEESFWPGYTNRIQGRLNQAGTLLGLRDISPGRNVQIIPYVAGRAFETRQFPDATELERRSEADAGVDLKWVLRDSLVFDLTVNPDFSQVESDLPQITTNRRFEVFFPEKRPFFLENAVVFQTPIQMLFTRRVQDPRVGLRATGKSGGWTLGALAIDDEAPGQLVPPGDPARGRSAYFGAVRASRDILDQSDVGLLYVERRFDGRANRVAGLDGRIKWNDHWMSVFQVAASQTETAEGERLRGPAIDVALNRTGRHLNVHLHFLDYDPEFEAAAGFVPRVGFRELHQSTSYTLRPEGRRLLTWSPGLFSRYVEDRDGTRLDWEFTPRLGWGFRGQTRLELSYQYAGERLRPVDFPALAADADFDIRRAGLTLASQLWRRAQYELSAFRGRTIHLVPPVGEPPSPADRLEAEAELTLLAGRRVRLDAAYIYDRLDALTGGTRLFTNQIARLRTSVQIDPKLSLRLIARHDRLEADPLATALESRRNLNGDLLVTYLINPWTALYAGVNSNYQELGDLDALGELRPGATGHGLQNDARQVFVKFSYLIRP